MKSYRRGLLCLGLLWLGAGISAAQQKPPEEDHPAPPGSSALPKIQQPPPPPPKVPDVRQPGETGWWFGLESWFPTQLPVQNAGRAATDLTEPAYIQLQGTPKFSDGAEFGIAVGLHNELRFQYFSTQATGNVTSIPYDLQLWSQTYYAGTWVSTTYHLQNAKISFDYLTWPYPVESRRFRLKTLWQVAYTGITTAFDAPLLPLFSANGAPILDANGNPISYFGSGNRWFINPEFGLGASYFYGRHLRLEMNAAGFGFPHRYSIYDGDATANLRFGHFELRAGAKIFHFKTSPDAEYFMKGTMYGEFVGIRWNSQ